VAQNFRASTKPSHHPEGVLALTPLVEPKILVSEVDLVKLLGLSRSTIWRLERQHKFPKRLQIGSRRVAWRLEEIEQFLASRQRGTGKPVCHRA
jgi:prophage regulatory protein